MKETLKLEDVLPLIEDTLRNGGQFNFFPHGTSMLPMIRQGIDSVNLVSPEKKKPEKGDVILYRRKNGDFVLHRIHFASKDRKTFTLCGDNQGRLEKNVPASSVIGVVTGYFRGETWIPSDDTEYTKYVKRRILSRPFRRVTSGTKRLLRKIFVHGGNK